MKKSEAEIERDGLVENLRKYLVGPLEENEEIHSSPPAFESAHDRYHFGFLCPAGEEIDEEEDDQDASEDDLETGAGDAILTLANVQQQSAMGLTFQVDGIETGVRLVAEWAEYRADPGSVFMVESNRRGPTVADHDSQPSDNANQSATDQRRETARVTRWIRVPIRREIDLPSTETPPGRHKLVYELDKVKIWIKNTIENNVRVVTVSVVNERKDPHDFAKDDRIYQVYLKVVSPEGKAIFVARPARSDLPKDESNLELLYREKKQFAVGHGCSVQWKNANPESAVEIRTAWIPETEVPKASPLVMSDEQILLLTHLSDESRRSETCEALEGIPDKYSQWIEQQESELSSVLQKFPEAQRASISDAAKDNLEACKRACQRIRTGIELLRSDKLVWKSFCLANNAMSRSMRKTRSDREPGWFAFQLAFILLCIPSTARASDPDRQTLDLLWFPTGGGKTEAYLGLAAFAIFLRRLSSQHPDDGAGTCVLTRYTLRLLTIQQFERAARLICACEIVRKGATTLLGSTPFTIGLFVGQGATPNTLTQARELLRATGSSTQGLTTLPLKKCPWCQVPLSPQKQTIKSDRLITQCPNADCEFESGLPLIVVDEEIYGNCPTMVVGTVDKFANMAWSPEMGAMLNGGAKAQPLDLIIQDELHLINDALGTMAALYETAVDYLCEKDGMCPKIVGSTATIRHAQEQCRKLFVRDALPFPPNGTIASDSFFYEEDHDNPGRLYVGVHAQGRSPKHTLARLLGIISQTTLQITNPQIRDSYHTIVTYFNSLRELGGALVLAEDDVPRYIKAMPRPSDWKVRELHHIKELTSHVPHSMLSEVFADLETPILELSNDLDREAIDLLFTTNMISVGVDVDRLGLMVVNGQPKTTAEYIQASSRIGRPRGSAGLVVVLYNWTRPRDRSHYERFAGYHQAFYRHVESSSVTPFSPRARDRALHAVLVSMVRIAEKSFAPNDSAAKIDNEALLSRVREIAGVIVERTSLVDPDEKNATQADLDNLIEQWCSEVTEGRRRDWQKRGPKGLPPMLRSPERTQTVYGLWPTPRSMRDVDPPASVVLLSAKQLEAAD